MSCKKPCKVCGRLTKSKYGCCHRSPECRAMNLRELRKTTAKKSHDQKYNRRRLRSSYDSLDKWVKRKMGNWRHSAKRRGLEFSIKFSDIPLVPKCSVTGVEFDLSPGRRVSSGKYSNHPSLDRINPNQGYIPGNVRLVTQSYNTLKSSIEHCPKVNRLHLLNCLNEDLGKWNNIQKSGEVVALKERAVEIVKDVPSYEWERFTQPALC